MEKQEKQENQEKKKTGCMPYIVSTIVELLILVAYVAVCASAVGDGFSGDIAGAVKQAEAAVWGINIAFFIWAIVLLVVKPLRCGYTTSMAILNVIWAGVDIYMMYA